MLTRHSGDGGKPAPSVTDRTEDGATDSIDVTFTGKHLPVTVFWQLRTQAAAAPTRAEIRNNTGGEVGGSYVASAVPDTENIDVTGAATGDKTLYMVLQDRRGFYSAITSGDIAVTAPDVTPPALTSPTDTQNGSSASTGSVSTDEGRGTLYWVITQSATSPSAAQVKLGQDHLGAAADDSGSQAVSATGVQNMAGSGLTASTTYYTHFMHEDAATNQSSVSSASGFTTDAASSFTFSLVQGEGELGADPANPIIAKPTEGNILVCVMGERSGGDPANHTVTDNGTGTTWNRIAALDIDNSVVGDESNTRMSQSVWWRKAVSLANECTQITTDDGTTNPKYCHVIEVAADAAYDWTFDAAAGTGSGASDWNGQGSGNASPAGSSIFELAIASSRISTSMPTVAGMSFSGHTTGKSARVGSSNQMAFITAFKSASQASGTKSSTLSSDGSGNEGVVNIACWKDGA